MAGSGVAVCTARCNAAGCACVCARQVCSPPLSPVGLESSMVGGSSYPKKGLREHPFSEALETSGARLADATEQAETSTGANTGVSSSQYNLGARRKHCSPEIQATRRWGQRQTRIHRSASPDRPGTTHRIPKTSLLTNDNSLSDSTHTHTHRVHDERPRRDAMHVGRVHARLRGPSAHTWAQTLPHCISSVAHKNGRMPSGLAALRSK